MRVVSSIGALAASIYVELGHLERGCLGDLLFFLSVTVMEILQVPGDVAMTFILRIRAVSSLQIVDS